MSAHANRSLVIEPDRILGGEQKSAASRGRAAGIAISKSGPYKNANGAGLISGAATSETAKL